MLAQNFAHQRCLSILKEFHCTLLVVLLCISLFLSGKDIGPTVLYFGCRSSHIDYIYKDELEGYRESGVLSDLLVACSRDQSEKVYVQHKLMQTGAAVWSLLEKQAYFYVCG